MWKMVIEEGDDDARAPCPKPAEAGGLHKPTPLHLKEASKLQIGEGRHRSDLNNGGRFLELLELETSTTQLCKSTVTNNNTEVLNNQYQAQEK